MSTAAEREEATRSIVAMLYERRMIRTFHRDNPKGWKLISGLYSPLYIQLRPLASYPRVFEAVCRSLADLIREEAPEVNRVIGVAMAGVPIAAGIALCGDIPAGFTRKMEGVKSLESFRNVIAEYGEHALVEGELASGDEIALVDDLVTRFDSKLVALEQVRHEVARQGLSSVSCKTVVVALDREQGGAEAARAAGVDFLRLIPFKSVGLPMLEDVMDPKEWEIVTDYLNDPEKYQDPSAQAELEAIALGR